MTEPGQAAWAALRAERPLSDGNLATRVVEWEGEESAILLGMDAPGDLHLLIPVPDAEVRRIIPDLNGLRVRLRVTEAGSYLGLSASPQHERVFTPVCREIIQAVFSEGREPWAAVDSIVRAWVSAWRAARPAMSQSVQIGLIGELIILSRVFMPVLGPAAVSVWSGPDSERHDFIAGMLHLEVKTTTRNRHEHEISRLDQLWAPQGRTLLLGSVRLEQSIGGTISVATLVDELTDFVRHEAWLIDNLLLKLSQLGWSDEMRRSGELLTFHLSDAVIYEVDADFPRLPEYFTPPSGVVALRYTISLANLPALDADEVSDLIRTSAEA